MVTNIPFVIPRVYYLLPPVSTTVFLPYDVTNHPQSLPLRRLRVSCLYTILTSVYLRDTV